MKSILQYTRPLLIVLLITGIGACKKDFLEVQPKGKLIAKAIADYQRLLTNLDLVNSTTDAQVAMGDEIAAVDPYFSGAPVRTQRLFRWDDIIYEPAENANELAVPLSNIYLYNKVINEVMEAADGTEQAKRSIQSQAMACRAWSYFLLINYYGKPYTASGSPADPGFPIITKADVTEKKFARATVKEVYDFIVNELVTAIPNLPTQITHRFIMSKAAAEGLLGKVYMFMGKFNEALPFLNAAIADLGSSSIPVGLYDYNTTFGTGGSFLPIGMFGPVYPTTPNNQENVYSKQYIDNWTFTNNEFVINPQMAALYAASDLRLNFYSNKPFFGSIPYPGGMLRRIGPIAAQIGVTVPDLYLLNAECKARLSDLPGAKTMVENFREKRMKPADAPVPSSIAGNQTALVKFILEERLREYAVIGFRWFDMRRLSVDPVYNTTVGNTHIVYKQTGEISASYTLKPERLVLRLPQMLMDQNPGMQNNP